MIVIDKIKTIAGTYVENLIEQKFGRLTVLELTDKKKSKHWLWKCKCDCGNICYVLASSLKSGRTTSCGCYRKERLSKINRQRALDLSGKKFERLTVLEKTNKRDNNKSVIWKCKCDCGNTCYVSARHLINGSVRSCGCLHRDKIFVDISGQRFGKLITIAPTQKRNNNREIMWLCKCDCGKLCLSSQSHLSSGHVKSCGCMISKGEFILNKILEENSINFIKQKTFDKCVNPDTNYPLRFDFYLPDYNCCIEYDGRQHYFSDGGWNTEEHLLKTKKRDSIKDKFCEDNNIRLVRIPYTDFNKIDANYILNRIGDKIEQ